MKRLILALVLGAFSVGSHAAQITFHWEGVIQGIYQKNGSFPFMLPFAYSFGDSITGSISFETDNIGDPYSNLLINTHMYYDARTTYTIDGFTFSPTRETNQLSLFDDDVSLNDGVTGFDQFQTSFTDDSFAPGYDVDGGIILRDRSASVFDSLFLPTNLNVSDFQVRHWSLWLHAEGANQLTSPSVELYGTITQVTSVPIPATVWLFGSALGFLGWMRRKSAY